MMPERSNTHSEQAGPKCPLAVLVRESGGQWGKLLGAEEDGTVVDLHIYARGITAQDFLPLVEQFEATFND